jgi:hypothetical protein
LKRPDRGRRRDDAGRQHDHGRGQCWNHDADHQDDVDIAALIAVGDGPAQFMAGAVILNTLHPVAHIRVCAGFGSCLDLESALWWKGARVTAEHDRVGRVRKRFYRERRGPLARLCVERAPRPKPKSEAFENGERLVTGQVTDDADGWVRVTVSAQRGVEREAGVHRRADGKDRERSAQAHDNRARRC